MTTSPAHRIATTLIAAAPGEALYFAADGALVARLDASGAQPARETYVVAMARGTKVGDLLNETEFAQGLLDRVA